VRAEKLDSLGRFVAGLPRIAWDNAAHCLLERTLDDSANRRLIIPQAFLAVDEILITTTRIIEKMVIDEGRVADNLARYGVFAASERVLMALARAGADRQAMHELIREHSMTAWTAIRGGEPNPLPSLLATDPALNEYLSSDQILALMDASDYTGDAAQRALALAKSIRERPVSGD
jgi:adenylosuccinate lyase